MVTGETDMCPHGQEFAPVGEMWGTEYISVQGRRVPVVCQCCNVPVRVSEPRCLSCQVEVMTDG